MSLVTLISELSPLSQKYADSYMPFEISMMWGFKLTHFTLIHFLLGAMLSHVVFKFDHTIPLFTTLSAFKSFSL